MTSPSRLDIITIDGPAGSGKSTLSRLLARQVGYSYLDTGAMYRAVALQARRKGIDMRALGHLAELCAELDLRFETGTGDNLLFIGGEDVSEVIRTPEMDLLSSTISAVKEVRDAMTALQRKIGREGKIVAEGRDMGTVVFPQAKYKFFLTAAVDIRAERRYRERLARGESVAREEVEKELRKRDEQDSRRTIAPLVPAKDAVIIDTSRLSTDQVMRIMLDRMRQAS